MQNKKGRILFKQQIITMKSLILKILTIFISLAMFLIISEFFLGNFIDPFSRGVNIGYFNKKFQKLNYYNDKNGFRNSKFLNNANIVILGDSVFIW